MPITKNMHNPLNILRMYNKILRTRSPLEISLRNANIIAMMSNNAHRPNEKIKNP